MLNSVDWKWFLIGIVFALFVLPFVQAQLGRVMGGRKTVTKNT